MIGSLRGTLLSKKPGEVVIEVSGVGYQVSVPTGTLSELPSEGHNAFLHIHTHVREDALQLYGFAEESEKRLFATLLGISGIGPKVALNVLSGISSGDFLKAVEAEDTATISRVPGIGKKTAQRIVLELRGKLAAKETARDRVFDDALSALVNLGYRKAESAEALERAQKKGFEEIEGLLKDALKSLTGASVEKV